MSSDKTLPLPHHRFGDDQEELKDVINNTEYRGRTSNYLSIAPSPSKLLDIAQAWFCAELHLNEINQSQQTFTIKAWINVFWKDKELEKTVLDDKGSSIKYKYWVEKQYITHEEFEEISRNYPLPIKPHDPFRNIIQRDDDSNKSRVWYDPANECFHLQFTVQCCLSEQFELDKFPFDVQFLNAKLLYDVQHYEFMSEIPAWVYPSPRYHYQIPLQFAKHDRITDWDIASPWIDLRKKNKLFEKETENDADFDFALIRIRIIRKPFYFLVFTVLPLFFIVTTSIIAVFALGFVADQLNEALADQLSYLITLLLTLAAYQYAISNDLPTSPELTYIDKYILSGYIVSIVLILTVSITSMLSYENSQFIILAMLLLVWFIITGYYIIYPYWNFPKNVNWKKKSDEEFKQWREEFIQRKSLADIDDVLYYGSEPSQRNGKPKKVTKYMKYVKWAKNDGHDQHKDYYFNRFCTDTEYTNNYKEPKEKNKNLYTKFETFKY